MRLIIFILFLFISNHATAGLITTYSDRTEFDAAVGATTLEDFTDTHHFPIPDGTLDSTSSFLDLNVGDIQEGATYTTPVGSGYYFNIDAGAGFEGGFLDGLNPSDRDLTISYDPYIMAFGFETNNLMPGFDLTINFLDGDTYQTSYSDITEMSFFGFQSDAFDITSVVISGNHTLFGFAIDNHVYGGEIFDTAEVPVPATLLLMLFGFFGLVLRKQRH